MKQIPKLEPPGAGIPAFQKFALRYIALPFSKVTVSWNKAIDIFEKESSLVQKIIDQIPIESRFEQVLVPSMVGLEDSSRYWSLAMTLEHITIVTSGIIEIMEKLSSKEDIDIVINTADVKPNANVNKDIIEEYKNLCGSFREQLESRVKNKHIKQYHKHPWFGPLNPHSWAILSAMHHGIHRKQIVQIHKLLVKDDV